MTNIKIRSEPFLWIHLAGIILFPVFLTVSTIGLSIGDSYPFVLELFFLIAIGVFPVLVMQLTRPFDIFSVLFLSLKPEKLNDNQRAILSLFKTFRHKLFSAIAAVIMLLNLWLLYHLSPLVAGLVDFLPQWRILGLGIAVLAFFASNLFLQIPLSVLLVLVTKQSKLIQFKPYPVEQINRDFTVPGIKVNKILWFLESETKSWEIT